MSYLKSRLDDGFVLAHLLLGLPLDGGTTKICVPDGLSDARVREFKEGWLNVAGYDGDTQEAVRIEAGFDGARYSRDLIANYLMGGADRYAIFEDPIASPRDPWLQEDDGIGQIFTCGQHVYHFLHARDLNESALRLFYEVGRCHWVSVGILTRFAPNRLRHRMTVDIGVLKQLAAASEHVLVDAYDLESDIVWSRQANS